MSLYIRTFPVGAFQCNCTIIADQEKGDAVVIDPGDEAEKIKNELASQGFVVKYLLHTHAHIDHIMATKELHQSCGGEICLHKADQMLYDNIDMQAQFLGLPNHHEVDAVTQYIEQGDVIEVPGLRFEVIHTPGHTPGSVCFYLDQAQDQNGQSQKIVFSGDTLFMGSIGRTDLWGGDYNQIIASIQEKLVTLDEKTLVIPGHGPKTTVGQERAENPFLKM